MVDMICSLTSTTARLLFGSLLCGLFFAFALGCQDPEITETTHFEAAEHHYRQGDFEAALTGYEDFLRRYPGSPLAETAEMRLRNIRREVSSVMERPGSPRPIYHGSRPDQSTAPTVELPPELTD